MCNERGRYAGNTFTEPHGLASIGACAPVGARPDSGGGVRGAREDGGVHPRRSREVGKAPACRPGGRPSGIVLTGHGRLRLAGPLA